MPMSRTTRRRQRQEQLSHLFPASGLRAQVRMGIRLARSTPGLSVYLGGGLTVWLVYRTLIGHGLAGSPLGTLVVGTARLLGLVLVVTLYFRRTGHLAQAWNDLQRLRLMVAERKPWQEEPAPSRRWLFRLLGWSLRVQG